MLQAQPLEEKAHDEKVDSMDEVISDHENEFVFPVEIELAPEITAYNKTYNVGNCDLDIETYLSDKYAAEIKSFTTFPDDIIKRFVIGYRHHNVFDKRLSETDKVFNNYLKWHKMSDFDNVLQISQINDVDIAEYLHGSYVYGQDKFGHPLFWDDGLKTLKDADNSIHSACQEKGMDIVTCYFARMMHEMKVATKRYYAGAKGYGYQHSVILNMNNFNFVQALKDRKIHEFYASRFSELAPEMLHRMYIINAPWIFKKAWAIISSFLDPKTVEKTKIMGKDYMNELLQQIDINMIPEKFGGKGKWEINYGSVPQGYPIQINK